MTKTEDARLAVVETDVKHIIDDIATVKKDAKQRDDSLKEYITDRIGAQKEAVSIAMAASKEAIIKAESATNLKFEISNNVKESLGVEIGILRDDFNKKIDELKIFQSMQTGAKTGGKDFREIITWVILIVGFIITYFVLRGV